MRISFVTSECAPFVKTGGLADVSGALPVALSELGIEVKVFLPLYDSIHTVDHGLSFCHELKDLVVRVGNSDVSFNTWYGHLDDGSVDVYLVDCPRFYHRGRVYTDDPDEDERFILLQRAAFRIMQQYAWAPDVIHANDWQTGLMPALLHHSFDWDALFHACATVFSIHNIAYQGRFSTDSIWKSGLPGFLVEPGGPAELHGSFSFMKAGVALADVVTTVSEQYANEIQTPEFGAGLDGILRHRSLDLHGILNGIDTSVWNPSVDKLIPQRYDSSRLNHKLDNKRALAEKFNLPFNPESPILGMVTRLTHQKGVELLQPILPALIDSFGLQFVILGSGEWAYEQFLNWAANSFPDNVGVYLGYNEQLSHLVEAGADIFLMPSRFEPCGLNQMYSLNYGTVPVVRKVGGLADTVHDNHEFDGQGNGFSFVDFSPYALYTSIVRALELYADKPAWRAIQRRGMKADFSWHHSAEMYVRAYEHALRKRRGQD